MPEAMSIRGLLFPGLGEPGPVHPVELVQFVENQPMAQGREMVRIFPVEPPPAHRYLGALPGFGPGIERGSGRGTARAPSGTMHVPSSPVRACDSHDTPYAPLFFEQVIP